MKIVAAFYSNETERKRTFFFLSSFWFVLIIKQLRENVYCFQFIIGGALHLSSLSTELTRFIYKQIKRISQLAFENLFIILGQR